MIHFVSADDRKIESYAALTRESKRAYCERWGHNFRDYDLTQCIEELSPAWALVWAMRQAMDQMVNGDWMLFTGADAVIIDQTFDVWKFIDDNLYMNTWLAYTTDINGLNTNGFLMRKSSVALAFLAQVWQMRGGLIAIGPHHWEEQGAFIKLLELPAFAYGAQVLPQEYTNGYEPQIYGGFYREPIFIAHYPGKKTDERAYFVKRALGIVPRVALAEGDWIDEHDTIRGPQ